VTPPLVLLAEDDLSVRMTVELVLQLEGFEVLAAEDGERALELARRRMPDVMLLDQMMPKMDGKQVLAALRSDEATKEIPVLILTGMAQQSSDEWLGAEFIGKPFDPEDLVARIRAALNPT
jgi:DNA-binding response OmpR family regulator